MIGIIGIDPGNKTGITYGVYNEDTGIYYATNTLHNFTPASSTKKREAEPEYLRYGKLFKELTELITDAKHNGKVYVVCEDAEGFMRGKAAVKVSHSYRGVIKACCCVHDVEYIDIQPMDLKYFVTGKKSSDKLEMIKFAREKYGYMGNDDNIADSIHLFHYGIDYHKRLSK